MQGVRLPGTIALLGLALVGGCTSSGGATPSSPPPSTSSQSVTTPSDTPIALPAGSPTPAERTLHRPAGATIVSFHTCITPSNIVILYIKNQIFGTGELDLQLSQLPGAGRLAGSERRRIGKARKTWLADGYPAKFPMVRELDSLIEIYTKIIAAAKAKNLDPLPDLYVRLEKVDGQYSADTGSPSVCEQ
ncbi:MAG TPA: hypothetical protein VE442_00790 [Jatrophihabitans sp.]|jgi:hypothetical protein|nr:hypothetical protein [Jatrophihabitans sp.]